MNDTNTGGVSFLGLLTVVFIVLKLTSVINWSWWWVLAPLWGPSAIALIVVAVTIVVGMLVAGFTTARV